MAQAMAQTFEFTAGSYDHQIAGNQPISTSQTSRLSAPPRPETEEGDVIVVSTCCGGPMVIMTGRQQKEFMCGQLIVTAVALTVFPIGTLIAWHF